MASPRPRGPFRRCDRILRPAEFEQVFAEGVRAFGRGFQIVARPALGPRSRLGLAVAKRAGHAPTRARVRRMARESFRSLRHDWPLPIELVLVVRDSSGPMTTARQARPGGGDRPPRLAEVHRALAKATGRLPWRRWQAEDAAAPPSSPLPDPQ